MPSKNSTFATVPSLSLADDLDRHAAGEVNIAPLAGLVIETVGGVLAAALHGHGPRHDREVRGAVVGIDAGLGERVGKALSGGQVTRSPTDRPGEETRRWSYRWWWCA